MKSGDIKKLLAVKHSGDVFVEECKLGSVGSRIMDAWTMKHSWANQVYTGYEIKVSRGDFIGDNKWMDYLQCCDRFYFVCPHGLIQKDEVGEKAGLMYVSKSGKQIRIVKKAPPIEHDVESVQYLMSYILMYRVKICDSTFGRKNIPEVSNMKFWEDWLEDKKHCRTIGRSVSKELWYRVESKIHAVQAENEGLEIENQKLSRVKSFLEKIGVDYKDRWFDVGTVDSKLFGEFRKVIRHIARAENSMANLRLTLESEIKKKQ